MEFVAVFALAAVVAIVSNWIAAMKQFSKYQTGSYFVKTFFSTVVIFIAIILAGILFRVVEEV
jgi:hypothetical protein